MAVARPRVPSSVARQLRREAGYGCCVCGFPVFEYHHIVPFSVEPHFRPEDMMVLCKNCHGRATAGAFPEREQRDAKARPRNIRAGVAQGQLQAQGSRYPRIGSMLFIGEGPLLIVDGLPLLSLFRQNGSIELS